MRLLAAAFAMVGRSGVCCRNGTKPCSGLLRLGLAAGYLRQSAQAVSDQENNLRAIGFLQLPGEFVDI